MREVAGVTSQPLASSKAKHAYSSRNGEQLDHTQRVRTMEVQNVTNVFLR